MKKNKMMEELSEDYCFICKDAGDLRLCDFKNCLKAYHPQCVGKDPSFLESDERWTCGWHSCSICQKASFFQCYCCPRSTCHNHSCLKDSEFVQVKKKSKGFCNLCLKLATLIEENVDVDSDGGKVDFTDTETYEFLFKDYWEIIKDQEGLTLIDLQAAKALLKRGKNCMVESDLERPAEDDAGSEFDYVDEKDPDFDDGSSFLEDLKAKRSGIKKPIKRSRSKMPKRKEFIGWGSIELIEFLKSIGKDTEEPLIQLDACEIIKEYIHEKNLQDPDKKKKKSVICDERLYALFKKKKVKYHKIYSLLESHFAANVDDSGDEFFFSSEEDDDSFGWKKKQCTSSGDKFNKSYKKNYNENVSVPTKSQYASIVGKNINSVYLKRSLIIELLKSPDTFGSKVTGCFVRVKLDPKEFYFVPEKIYKLGQVTGVKKALQAYKIREMSTDVVLCVSNMDKDVQISMLSDDDFEEDECEDLLQLAKKGLFSRPTVVELEEKIRCVHSDIMNHLRKPEERERLLQEIPPVIADTCEFEEKTYSQLNFPAEVKGKDMSCEKPAEGKVAENKYPFHVKAAEEIAGNGVALLLNADQRALAESKLVKATCTSTAKTSQVSEIEEAAEVTNSRIPDNIQIVELFENEDRIWHYIGDSGNEHGPFDMVSLRFWMNEGFFDEDFRVWRTGQSREDAILLTDALRLCQ
ncbi:hypothetical protein Cni_G12341 [Canna indica]|uniref:Uncharacterized protein n=1 Tax=Canna indica TaxID=4628 RepID=A0AAQ3Q8X9_9LILI|nr:hypothetical protein Cni_G12341 [Canna indica]